MDVYKAEEKVKELLGSFDDTLELIHLHSEPWVDVPGDCPEELEKYLGVKDAKISIFVRETMAHIFRRVLLERFREME